jgi:putative membrane protein
MMAAFLAAYTAVTPQREWTLIREGNLAAAISLGGALIGFALPLATVIAHTTHIIDVAIWGAVALVVQLLLWAVVNLLDRGLAARVTKGETASGVFLAAASIAGGIVNAACMTY